MSRAAAAAPGRRRADPVRRLLPRSARTVALLVAILGLGAGCGYSSKRLVDVPGVRTVAVLQFENDTYRRDLEFRLTRALAEEVRARTAWRIATPGTADALLTGTIRSAEIRVLAEDKSATPISKRFRLVVDARLLDRATGRLLADVSTTESQEFAEGYFGESLDGSATDTVMQSLAQAVIAGFERPIGAPDRVPVPDPPPVRVR